MYILCLILLGTLSNVGLGQSLKDLEALRQVVPAQPKAKTQWDVAQNNSNEAEWVLSQAFLFYKAFISSQDGNRCSFYPSCSVYSLQAVKKRGLIFGGLATFDRLMRCNSLSPELYSIDIRRRLLIDHP
ncbi:MAG: membrane protein insertion efficiency factor YidD [Bacteroidota bacterium]